MKGLQIVKMAAAAAPAAAPPPWDRNAAPRAVS